MTDVLKQAPGPRGGGLTGQLTVFARDPLQYLTDAHRQYGDVVAFRMGALRFLSLTNPDHIEYVLQKANKQFIKNLSVRRGKVVLGNGLFTSEGEFWLRQRRLAQPAFHRDRINAYSNDMVSIGARAIERWQPGEVREIMSEMGHITMAVVTRTLFSVEMGPESDQIGEVITTTLREWNRMAYRIPFTDRWPLPGNLRLWRAVKELDRLIYSIIERRRQNPEDTGDLLSMLLNARDEDGSHMTDKQLRDEVTTLFGAGHETTATALTWAWYLLSQHPEVEAKLSEELQRVLSGRLPSLSDLPQLPYTGAVIQETMRLYPPAWIVAREATADFEVGGVTAQKGTTVFMPQWVVHRDPRWFENPQRFNPDRWLDGLEKRLPHYAYFPFGGGPRVCIGRQFAQMEAALLLATIAQRFRFTPEPNQVIVPEPSITLRPLHGIKMRLAAR